MEIDNEFDENPISEEEWNKIVGENKMPRDFMEDRYEKEILKFSEQVDFSVKIQYPNIEADPDWDEQNNGYQGYGWVKVYIDSPYFSTYFSYQLDCDQRALHPHYEGQAKRKNALFQKIQDKLGKYLMAVVDKYRSIRDTEKEKEKEKRKAKRIQTLKRELAFLEGHLQKEDDDIDVDTDFENL